MYGLSPGTDLSFLHGQALSQVCVGENEVILNFDDGASIAVASDARVGGADGEQVLVSDSRALGRTALDLIGDVVETARVVQPGTTQIVWASGRQTDLLDSWSEYESYTITHRDRTIIV